MDMDRIPTEAEIAALRTALETVSQVPARDGAIVALLLELVRYSELRTLRLSARAVGDDGAPAITLSLVPAKAAPPGRYVALRLGGHAAQAVDRLLAAREAHDGAPRLGAPLFPASGPYAVPAIRSFRCALTRAAHVAGTPGLGGPHSLRRGAMTIAVERGVSLGDVMRLARHRGLGSLEGYLRRADGDQ